MIVLQQAATSVKGVHVTIDTYICKPLICLTSPTHWKPTRCTQMDKIWTSSSIRQHTHNPTEVWLHASVWMYCNTSIRGFSFRSCRAFSNNCMVMFTTFYCSLEKPLFLLGVFAACLCIRLRCVCSAGVVKCFLNLFYTAAHSFRATVQRRRHIKTWKVK